MAVGLGGRVQKSKVNLKVKYDFSTNKDRSKINVIPYLCVILIKKSIPYIILMMQCHLRCQMVNFILLQKLSRFIGGRPHEK